jgi:hypothetical protein
METSNMNESKHICDICHKAFATDDLKRTHKSRKHKAEVALKSEDIEARRKERCEICNQGFTTKKALKAHMK